MVLLCFVYVRKSVSFSSNLFSRLNIASIMVLLETSELLTWSANFAFLSAGFKSTPSPLDLHSGLCGIVVLRFWNAAFSLIVTWHLLIFGVQSQSSPFSTVFTISVKKLLHKSPSCAAHQPTLKVCQLKLKKKKYLDSQEYTHLVFLEQKQYQCTLFLKVHTPKFSFIHSLFH